NCLTEAISSAILATMKAASDTGAKRWPKASVWATSSSNWQTVAAWESACNLFNPSPQGSKHVPWPIPEPVPPDTLRQRPSSAGRTGSSGNRWIVDLRRKQRLPVHPQWQQTCPRRRPPASAEEARLPGEKRAARLCRGLHSPCRHREQPERQTLPGELPGAATTLVRLAQRRTRPPASGSLA